MNMIAVIVASIIPLLIGFIYYHPKVFGNTWMKTTGLTEEMLKKGNMPLIFGISLVFSFMLSLMMTGLVIHQSALSSLLQGYPEASKEGAKIQLLLNGQDIDYKNLFRTFKHGVLHGIISAIFIALPILGINSLFERKSFKYIFLHLGYWIITLGIMGGIICAWQ